MGDKRNSFVGAVFLMAVLTLIAAGITFAKLGILQVNLIFVVLMPLAIGLLWSLAVKD